MELINLEQAISFAEEMIREKGADYIYVNPDGVSSTDGADCCNWDRNTNQPSCIVGWILYRAGVPEEKLIDHNTEAVYMFKEYLEGCDFGKVFEFLANLQNLQDQGETWGKALEKARQIVC